jgi:hypothetical protein
VRAPPKRSLPPLWEWRRFANSVRRAIYLVAALLATSIGTRAAVGADEVPAEQQVLILSRALVYDDNFKQRVGTDVRLAVISKAGNTGSDACAAAMIKAFKGVGNLKLAGLPLKTSQVPFKDTAAFGTVIAADEIDVIYLCPGLETNLGDIVDLTRKRRVITVGSREDYVKRGASLGVFLVNGRPTIMVNLPASRSEGASFSSDLLRLATVLK